MFRRHRRRRRHRHRRRRRHRRHRRHRRRRRRLPGAKLPLMVESFGPLNDLFPFPSILDAGYPVFYLHLANVLFDVILPSVLGSSL